MVLSMTGYGSAEIEEDGYRFTVEIRSTNGRFCEVRVRLPTSIAALERQVIALVQKHVSRGNVNVSIVRNNDQNLLRPSVDLDAARAYRDELSHLKEELGLVGEIDLRLLSGLPGVFSKQEEAIESERAWSVLQKGCLAALEDLTRMRESEGNTLYEDLVHRIDVLDDLLREIERLAPLRVEAARERLRLGVQALLQGQSVDEARLETEIAIFAERSDITEECVRARSHSKQFLNALGEDAPGRRLNFLAQEMHREANTIGAKANDADIGFLTVRMKEEIEKLREQVQNVE